MTNLIGLFAALTATWWALSGAPVTAAGLGLSVLAGAVGTAAVWRFRLAAGAAAWLDGPVAALRLVPLWGRALSSAARAAATHLGAARARPALLRYRTRAAGDRARAQLAAAAAAVAGAHAIDMDDATLLLHVAQEDAVGPEALTAIERRLEAKP